MKTEDSERRKAASQLFRLNESQLILKRNLHLSTAGLSFVIIALILQLKPINDALFVSLIFAIIGMPLGIAVAWIYRVCILYGERSYSHAFSQYDYLLATFSFISIITFSASVGALIASVSISLLWLYAITVLLSLILAVAFNFRHSAYIRKRRQESDDKGGA